MNFVNTHYLPHIILGALIFAGLLIYLNYKFYNWVKLYWFFQRSWLSRVSTFIYIISIVMMLLSLLDLRGPEQKVKASLPDQRTIIVIDSSASMLAEDVRSSRFGKAIQLARHFVKNAAGHQISIVLFSDIQKRLIPFTDDIDLLDSRLAALEKTNSVSGGSNISQAIAEAIGYFDFEDKKTGTGNVLVFTDAEESEGGFDADIGNNINLAIVGIGTAKGANIPLRWEDGSFRGYKNQKDGQPVVTKLDEEYIKKIGKNVKNYKYWIANSYSLPTEEILNFFRGTYNKANNKGDMRVRPVFSHFILIPAILLYCLSVLIGRFKSFKTIASMVILSIALASGGVKAQDEESIKAKEIPVALKKDMDKMKSGNADRKEILKIAEKLLKNNDDARASELYKEYSRSSDDVEVEFNRATALLKTQKLDEAMPLIRKILKNSKNEDLKDKLRHNILLSIKEGGQDKNGKKDDKKDDKDKKGKEGDKDKKDSKDGKGDKDKKDNKDNKDKKDGKDKDSKDSSDKDKDQKQKKSEGKDDKDDKNKDKKDKPGKDPKDLDMPERPDSAPKSLEEKEKDIEQKRKLVKTPAMIKQILSDDRELQKKMMDTSTNDRAVRNKRDW
jgi:Ca-activated chloride channel family protein